MAGVRKCAGYVVTTLLVGCGSAAEMPPDGGSSIPVVGRMFTTCHQLPADVDVPVDLSQRAVRALIPDASATGYRVVTGTASADGTFAIDGVPTNTTYMLQIDDPPSDPRAWTDLYVTSAHDLELRREQVSRCLPAPSRATQPAFVDIDLTNMQTPFDMFQDRMELQSYTLDYRVAVFGVTSEDAFENSAEWPASAPLVDAAAGDDLHVVHVRTERDRDPVTSLPRTITRAIERFDATGTSLQVGHPAVITGQFPAMAPGHSASLSIDHDEFMAGYDAGTAPIGISVDLVANPVSAVAAAVAGASIVFGYSLDGSNGIAQGVSSASLMYSDPFPSSWKHALKIEYGFVRFVRLSSGVTASGPGGYYQIIEEPGQIAVQPQLPPPRGITVGGADFVAGGSIAFDGQSPIVVRWSPVASANVYRLTLLRSTGNPDPQFRLATSSVSTADTMLTLPATLFDRGGIYQFELSAIQTPTDYAAGHLLLTLVPRIATTALSGRFRFTASCGDGKLDPDEDCDTSGESATCNIDCTPAMCGDGLRNAAAGEACDAPESAGCNRNCTLRSSP